MRNKILIIIGLVIIISIIALLLLPYKVVSTKMYLTVTEEGYGVTVDTDALWFGSITRGSGSRRPINISVSKDSKIVIKATGELAKWITISENNFRLGAGGEAEIWVKITAPQNAQIGNHEGTLSFYVYRDFSYLKK